MLVAEPWLRRYSCHDVLVRQLLWWRAFWKHGKKDADEALITRDEFVQVCLMGVQPAVAARTNKETGVRHAAQVRRLHLLFAWFHAHLVLACATLCTTTICLILWIVVHRCKAKYDATQTQCYSRLQTFSDSVLSVHRQLHPLHYTEHVCKVVCESLYLQDRRAFAAVSACRYARPTCACFTRCMVMSW